MKSILKCRRTFVSLFAIVALTILGIAVKADVAGSIAVIAMALSGANSAQAIFAFKGGVPKDTINASNGTPKDTIKDASK